MKKMLAILFHISYTYKGWGSKKGANKMKTQLAKVYHNGTWRVIHDDTKKNNAYRVTLNNRKVTDYADFASCLWHITQELSR